MSKKFYSGFKKLEDNVSKIIKPISKKKKDNFIILNNLAKNWENIVGAKYAAFCFPKKLSFNPQNQGTLFISAFNSSAAFALDSNQNYMLEKIASHFGYKIISAIKISQELREVVIKEKAKKLTLKAEDEEFIKETTKNIKDETLRHILQKLGESILTK